MHVLVTSGNTMVPIDRVRAITNIFTGRTGTAIALEAVRRGHRVTLLTSHPERVAEMHPDPLPEARWTCGAFRTFDQLHAAMRTGITGSKPDAVIHCAAVSDYQSAGVYAPAPGTCFDPGSGRWLHTSGGEPTLQDKQAGKVKSDEEELWIRLTRAPKLVDQIREPWNFAGVLVKFKLEVDKTDEELLAIAERSRRHSRADLMVANTLEGAADWAYVGPTEHGYLKIPRRDLAERLMECVERLGGERSHG